MSRIEIVCFDTLCEAGSKNNDVTWQMTLLSISTSAQDRVQLRVTLSQRLAASFSFRWLVNFFLSSLEIRTSPGSMPACKHWNWNHSSLINLTPSLLNAYLGEATFLAFYPTLGINVAIIGFLLAVIRPVFSDGPPEECLATETANGSVMGV